MRSIVLLSASLLATVLLASGVALAAVSAAPDSGTVNTDGRVKAVLAMGDRVYLGGSFTHVDGVPRNRLAAVDATTGQLTDWNPNANGAVFSLAATPDGSRVYAGGNFTEVGGATHRRLVSLDAQTGAVNTAFKIGLGASVRAIAVSGGSVYIGGDFTSAKGQTRHRLALVDATTAALDQAWAPSADKSVWALALSSDHSRLYAGGAFGSISGEPRRYLAGLDASGSGAIVWRPLLDPNGRVYDLAPSGQAVYSAEGGPGGAAAAYDAATGARPWVVKGDGDVQAVAVEDGRVYLGGHFLKLEGNGRRFFAAADATTGLLDPWNPTGSGSGAGVWDLEPDPAGTLLYAGGDFTGVSGETHRRFAGFSE